MRVVRVDGPSREATFYARTGDHLTYALEHGYYEADLLEAIKEYRLRGTFIDVGAHIGNHTVFFALECHALKVLAIESNPETFTTLCANVLVNGLCGRVECLNAAVHPEWTSAHVVPAPNGNSGMSGVGSGGSIPVVRLDDLRNGHVGLIKVDTEGSSLDVLRSAQEILRRDHPLVAAEAINEGEREAVREFLLGFGYERQFGPYAVTPVYLFR